MKITVLNGSPKGKASVTMQYVRYIQQNHPEHEFVVHNISYEIKKLEKNTAAFDAVIADIKTSRAVLWATPVYVCLVPSQYKRFIELVHDKKAARAFAGKYAVSLTTSIHFFDNTAHEYLNAISDDLGMKFAGSYSADMFDLVHRLHQAKVLQFAEDIFTVIEEKRPVAKKYLSLKTRAFAYVPSKPAGKIDTAGKNIVVCTDVSKKGDNLDKMVSRFRDAFGGHVDVFNIRDINIKGGCLGCIKCGYDNVCAWTGKDDFIDFFNSRIICADILILAGEIRDRYLSWQWKQFFDRSFFNTHRPVLKGKQIGFIVSGPLGQIPNLRQILEAYTQWHQANLIDFVIDETGTSREIDARIDSFAKRAVEYASRGYLRPATFLGVGGTKIFRDDVYGKLRFAFLSDHAYYKKHGVYDFPHKNYKMRLTNAMFTLMMRIPKFRKKIIGGMKYGMLQPFKRIVGEWR